MTAAKSLVPNPDHIALDPGTSSPPPAFPSHAHVIKPRPGQPPDRRLCASDRAGSARPGDAAASDRAAIPATHGRLHPAGPSEPRHHAGRHHDGSIPGTARRQTGQIRRRALPARRCRPRDARPGAEYGWHHARHPAPRQPRRRPERQAEINKGAVPSFASPRLPGEAEIRAKARISVEGDSPRV